MATGMPKKTESPIGFMNELAKVRELTGAAEEQIALHDDGYWSRAYVVDGGEFVVKFPKHEETSYEDEARFLHLLNAAAFPVNMQKVKWLSGDRRCIAVYGVKGTPLTKTGNLTVQQKKSIGGQIAAFLKLLHSLDTDFGGQTLEAELFEYQKMYRDCADFYERHFTLDERRVLDVLMHVYLPSARKDLGEKLVFCHADIWEPNILLDSNGRVGVIDCGNAGYYDEAADFGMEDGVLRGFILDHYGAGEALRKKVELKYDMSTVTCPKFGVPLWGEPYIVEKWVPLIRGVIEKYRRSVSS